MRRGMVVLVRLPGDKARPAVVLRSDALARLPYATVVGLTTTAHRRAGSAPACSANAGEWPPATVVRDGGLAANHSCRAYGHMGEIVGHLDSVTLEAITGRVAVVLGIGERRTEAAS